MEPYNCVRTALSIGLSGALLLSGCGVAPKAFTALGSNPAGIKRARAVGLGDRKSEEKVIPSLIERLNDSDPVVRLSAHEELKRRTSQDFGYIPWAEEPDRAAAVESWKRWWAAQGESLNRG